MKDRVRTYLVGLQDRICADLEALDGEARFVEDRWTHAADGASSPGGGRTRVLAGGGVFEKGAVNYSEVRGVLSERLAARLKVEPQPFYATGVSLVMHPRSPHVPTVHMNVRYIELPRSGDAASGRPLNAWFGGGADLTPYYRVDEDAVHFHRVFKQACDRHDPAYYPRFKRWCDEYFFNKHRGEARGVGGIFFDYLKDDPEGAFAFVRDVGDGFADAYGPIVRRRSARAWTEAERHWQAIRRGRYVEFNLVYDRGTLFGLETGGRPESILVSMPPQAAWVYDHHPEPGSAEAALVEVLRYPRDWLAE